MSKTIITNRKTKTHREISYRLSLDRKHIDTKSHPKDTVSILIPCKPGHVSYLDTLISTYNNGTVRPNEIVIAINNANSVRCILNSLATIDNVKIVETSNELIVNAAYNRNEAIKKCSSDIVIYNDADDLPSTQRVEIIKNTFINNDVVHVLHMVVPDRDKMLLYNDINNIDISHQSGSAEWFNDTRYGICKDNWSHCHIGMGVPAVLRAVHNTVLWHEYHGIEDQMFNRDISTIYQKSCIIDAKIYYYSSFKY